MDTVDYWEERARAAEELVEQLKNELAALTIKYQALVRWFDDHEGTPCEQIRHHWDVEALKDELAKLQGQK